MKMMAWTLGAILIGTIAGCGVAPSDAEADPQGLGASVGKLPLAENVIALLPTGGARQSYDFIGRTHFGAIRFTASATNNGGPAFIPHLVVTTDKGKLKVVDAIGDVAGGVDVLVTLPKDAVYRVSVGATDHRGGEYSLAASVHIVCVADSECPSPLTCQVPGDILDGAKRCER